MLTHGRIRELLDYNPETGVFTWRVNRPPRAKRGAIAGVDNGSGYQKISVDGKRHYSHRLAFLWMTGAVPSEIDHINQCRGDNRWANLRAATRETNLTNVAGRIGIRFRAGKFEARMQSNRRYKTIGRFETYAEAEAAYRSAKEAAAGDFAPHRRPVGDIKPSQLPPKRAHRAFTYKGKTLSEWSRETGIPQPTLHYRIFIAGKKPKDALGI